MSVQDRLKAIKGIACTNCLRKDHVTANCQINRGCKVCHKRHHALLHIFAIDDSANNNCNQTEVVNVSSLQSSFCDLSSSVLLSTVAVKIKTSSGDLIDCTALIDNASQFSLITEQLVNKLNLPVENSIHRLTGMNGLDAETSLHNSKVEFQPHFCSQIFDLQVYVVKKVTSPLPNLIRKANCFPLTSSLIKMVFLELGDASQTIQPFHSITSYLSSFLNIIVSRLLLSTIFIHAGQELMLSLIRQKFWIPDGRSIVRQELRKCLTCHKFNAKPVHPKMGNLP